MLIPWALAQLVGRGKRTFAPTGPQTTNLEIGLENSSSAEPKQREKPPGALAQLVGQGNRTFAPNKAPNLLLKRAEKFRLRSSALQQIRSADRHLKMPPGSRLSPLSL